MEQDPGDKVPVGVEELDEVPAGAVLEASIQQVLWDAVFVQIAASRLTTSLDNRVTNRNVLTVVRL
jgi:hypothetical protein